MKRKPKWVPKVNPTIIAEFEGTQTKKVLSKRDTNSLDVPDERFKETYTNKPLRKARRLKETPENKARINRASKVRVHRRVKQFYVYIMHDKEHGIFYVGSGAYGRLNTTRRVLAKDKLHPGYKDRIILEHREAKTEFYVTIVHVCNDRALSFRVESYISEHLDWSKLGNRIGMPDCEAFHTDLKCIVQTEPFPSFKYSHYTRDAVTYLTSRGCKFCYTPAAVPPSETRLLSPSYEDSYDLDSIYRLYNILQNKHLVRSEMHEGHSSTNTYTPETLVRLIYSSDIDYEDDIIHYTFADESTRYLCSFPKGHLQGMVVGQQYFYSVNRCGETAIYKRATGTQ